MGLGQRIRGSRDTDRIQRNHRGAAQVQGPGFWYCEIAVTGRCNFACTYCNRMGGQIDLDQVCAFITENCSTLRHVQLTGGEPTLYPHLKKLCRFIKDQGIKVGISTNGSATMDLYRALDPHMFSISLDDYDEDILKQRGYTKIKATKNRIIQLTSEGIM